jgi:hypothetical protein
MNTEWIGKKVRIILHLEDHVGYKGQELTITEVLENDYVMVTDGTTEWCPGIEETDYFKNT